MITKFPNNHQTQQIIMLHSKLRGAFIGFFLIINAIHAIATYQEYRMILSGASEPITPPGRAFAELAPFLKNQKTIGYFTDRDFSPESLTTQNFLSAQYELAPVALDVNNKNHPLILVDASVAFTAIRLMEQLQTVPIYSTSDGKLLVEKQ